MPDKPLYWVGSSLDDLKAFPMTVQRVMGFALRQAQGGDKHEDAKPLAGFSGAGVLEVVEQYAGNAYRAVYTVRFSDAVYVLHAFRKKSRRGIATPQKELDLVRQRLARAQEMHEEHLRRQSAGE
jgi:phage-related protein